MNEIVLYIVIFLLVSSFPISKSKGDFYIHPSSLCLL